MVELLLHKANMPDGAVLDVQIVDEQACPVALAHEDLSVSFVVTAASALSVLP
ncbi:hypothetical protein [Rubellimicrobium rubrum]|uniref:hypothetical protein n=1 Tax=Rubellimicrobium rubrum TaxID=2585369 RepID=UPI00159B9755|nr:hypothetical protein [Rubellimicrobium rubrum]